VRNVEHHRHPDKFCKRICSHFMHDLTSMDLQGYLADIENCCGLLVEQTANDKRKDLALPKSQGAKSFLKSCSTAYLCPVDRVPAPSQQPLPKPLSRQAWSGIPSTPPLLR
jgi:hypothetical protein